MEVSLDNCNRFKSLKLFSSFGRKKFQFFFQFFSTVFNNKKEYISFRPRIYHRFIHFEVQETIRLIFSSVLLCEARIWSLEVGSDYIKRKKVELSLIMLYCAPEYSHTAGKISIKQNELILEYKHKLY